MITGEVRQIGPHALSCGSLVDAQLPRMLATLNGRKVRVLYSDPPWGDGNLSYWKTINQRMTGRLAAQVTHVQLWDAFVHLIVNHVEGYVFVETGKRWMGQVGALLTDRAGVEHLQPFEVQYKSGSKLLTNILFAGVTRGWQRRPNVADAPKYVDAELSKYCVGAVAEAGQVVLDPCCGMGNTARAALLAGMVFYGNELNSKRLEKTERSLEGAVQ